jgi:Glycosyltransferases involved in cell wall biogenesis
VIIVDNGSTDGTAKLLNEMASSNDNLSFVLLGENKGACYARNVAIKQAKGKFVTGSDDDDVWHLGRLKSLHDAYDDKLAFTYGDDCFVLGNEKFKKNVKPNAITIGMMKYQNEVGNQVFTTKEKFLGAGLFDEYLVAAQDYDMWFRLLLKYGVSKKAINAVQYIYLDGNARITASNKKRYGYFDFYMKHRSHMSRNQRKHQLLTIKYICNSSITALMFNRLFSFNMMKRKSKIFLSRVIFSGKYGF